jgi:hypothetical protein
MAIPMTLLHVREIVIWVPGYPPAENEAKPMLAAGHVHADRVLAPLRAASDKARPGDTQSAFPASLLAGKTGIPDGPGSLPF